MCAQIFASQGSRSWSFKGSPRRILSTFSAVCRSSQSRNVHPRLSASARPTVLLPEPETPITMICLACMLLRENSFKIVGRTATKSSHQVSEQIQVHRTCGRFVRRTCVGDVLRLARETFHRDEVLPTHDAQLLAEKGNFNRAGEQGR